MVTDEEHSQEEDVKGDIVRLTESNSAVLKAVLLLLSELKEEELNTVKGRVQQLLTHEWLPHSIFLFIPTILFL